MMLLVCAVVAFVFCLSIIYDFIRINAYIRARERRLELAGSDFDLSPYDTKKSRVMDQDSSSYDEMVDEVGDQLKNAGAEANGMLSTAPPSVVRVVRECIVMVGGSAAVLEQLMHPYVALALKNHSYLLGEDGFKRRFYRTFQYVFDAMYGDWKDIYNSVSTVRRTHSRIRGTIEQDLPGGYYSAGDSFDALNEQVAFWVYATLMDNSVAMYETCCGELPEADKEELYRWHRANLTLWDIRPEAVPNDWKTFERYFAAMCHSGMLAPTAYGCKYAKMLLRPIAIEKHVPGMNSGRLAALLFTPAPVREMLQLKRTRVDYALGVFLCALTASVYRWLPGQIRYFSKFNLRAARMRGRPGELSWLEKMSQRLGTFIVDQTLGGPQDRQAKKKS